MDTIPEFKKSSRGGKREGAGRKSNYERQVNDTTSSAVSNEEQNDNTQNTELTQVNSNYQPRINVLRELEKLYKKVNKSEISREELEFVRTKIDILSKLLPYVSMKKPVQSVSTASSNVIPNMTILAVKDSNENKETTDVVKENNEHFI